MIKWLDRSASSSSCRSQPLPLFLPLSRQVHNEEVSRERGERQRLERDLEEASRRLAMAHQDIRRLTNELDAARNNNVILSGMSQKSDSLKFSTYFKRQMLRRGPGHIQRLTT